MKKTMRDLRTKEASFIKKVAFAVRECFACMDIWLASTSKPVGSEGVAVRHDEHLRCRKDPITRMAA